MSFFQVKNNQKEFFKKIKQKEQEAEKNRKQEQSAIKLAAVIRKFLSNRVHVAPIVKEAQQKITAIVIRKKMMSNAVFKMPIIMSPLTFITYQTLQGYSNYVLKLTSSLMLQGNNNLILKKVLEANDVRTIQLLKLVQFSIILSKTQPICQQFLCQFVNSCLNNQFSFDPILKILTKTSIPILKQLLLNYKFNPLYQQTLLNEILFKHFNLFANIIKPLQIFLSIFNVPTLSEETLQKIFPLIDDNGSLNYTIQLYIQSKSIEDLIKLYYNSTLLMKRLVENNVNTSFLKSLQIHYFILQSYYNAIYSQIYDKFYKKKMAVEDQDEINYRQSKVRKSQDYGSFLKTIQVDFYFGSLLKIFKTTIQSNSQSSVLENIASFYLLLETIFRKTHTKIFRLLTDIKIIVFLFKVVCQLNSNNMNFKQRDRSTIILQLFIVITYHRFVEMDDSEFMNQQTSFDKSTLQNVIKTLLKLIILLTKNSIKNTLFDYANLLLNNIYGKVFRTKLVPLKLFETENLDQLLEKFNITKKQHNQVQLLLKTIPFGFSFQSRLLKLRQFIKADKKNFNRNLGFDQDYDYDHTIQIRRGHQFNDAFHQLIDRQMRQKYRIVFINAQGMEQQGVDGGGIIKQLINQVIKVAFDPVYGLFVETTNKQIIPNPHSNVQNTRLQLEFIGKLVGKAIYENILIQPKFSGPFLNIMIGKQNSFEDLQFLDKALYNSLLNIKHTNQNIQMGQFTFSFDETDPTGKIKTTQLKENGRNIGVTQQNKLQFVMSYADYKVNRQFFQQGKLFRKGFTKIIQQQWLQMFNYQQINLMISGNSSTFNVFDLMQNTEYDKYQPKDLTIRYFWQVINQMSLEDKSLFLHYVTSCSRPPTLGFKQLKPKFCISKSIQQTTHLPTVHTCMNLLKLPDYKNKQLLKEKIMYAIHSKSGFQVT